MIDNNPTDGYYYQILVFTGHRKDAGTKSKVTFERESLLSVSRSIGNRCPSFFRVMMTRLMFESFMIHNEVSYNAVVSMPSSCLSRSEFVHGRFTLSINKWHL